MNSDPLENLENLARDLETSLSRTQSREEHVRTASFAFRLRREVQLLRRSLPLSPASQPLPSPERAIPPLSP